MFLIKKCLEGNSLPPQLPPSLLQEPQRFIQPTLPDKLPPCTTLNSTSSTSGSTIDSNEWSISAALRPKYKLQFNQNDRNKRGYLTGVEARGIFLKSNLPQSQLAAIWNLADVDRDGNLTCEEFCIASYLIDQVLAGRKLPLTLPLTLMPSSFVSLRSFFFLLYPTSYRLNKVTVLNRPRLTVNRRRSQKVGILLNLKKNKCSTVFRPDDF